MNEVDLLDDFAIKAYAQPLALHRDSGRIADTSDPISVVMLVVDLDTEVAMNGIADFIGNRTGRYAAETVDALERIGSSSDAAKLQEILEVAAAAGMTHETIQAARTDLAQYTITSFATLHGTKWNPALTEIETICRTIDFNGVIQAARRYLMQHEAVFREALGR
jgi:hypothetical protein